MNQGQKVTFGDLVISTPDKLVIGKIGSDNIQDRQKKWLLLIESIKASGGKIYLDYTDHHLGFDSQQSGFYRNVLRMVDTAITPSQMMQQNLAQFYFGPIKILEDAIDCSSQEIKLTKKPTTFLWFGHSSNIQSLTSFIKEGFRAEDQIRLIILSNQVALNYLTNTSLVSKAKIEIKLAIWSPQAMIQASQLADACIIPVNNSDPMKMGASSNRLITAFALGLPVATGNLKSYEEFKKYCVDINGEEFRSLIKDPSIFHGRIRLAQQEVVPRFSIENISKKWVELLTR